MRRSDLITRASAPFSDQWLDIWLDTEGSVLASLWKYQLYRNCLHIILMWTPLSWCVSAISYHKRIPHFAVLTHAYIVA